MGAPTVGLFRHTLFLPSERFIPDQARALPRWKPILFARDPIVDPVQGLDSRRIEGVAGSRRTLQYALGASRGPIARTVRANRLDLVHAHFGVEGLYTRRGAAQAGVPHVVTLHGFDVTYSSRHLLRSRRPAWLRYAAQRADLLRSSSHFICVSRFIQRAAEELGLDPMRSVVIPTGVDTDRLAPAGLPNTVTIAHVARLVEKKGTAFLIQAVGVLRRRGVGAVLEIVGDGPLRSELEALAKSEGLVDVVRFRGALPHDAVVDIMRRARVVCQPSVRARSGDAEGLGQAVLEGGALGRPLVVTANGGMAEIVEPGRSGFVVREREVGELADALERVLTDDPFAAQLGRAGADRVRAEFDLRKQASRVADFYDDVVRRHVQAPDSPPSPR